MSTLAVDAIVDSSNGNTATINGATPTAYNTMGKNRIINGAMEIDQRNAGASVAFTSAAYKLDRWVGAITSGSGHTIQKSSTAPQGQTSSAFITVSTGASPSAGSVNRLYQVIEGYNIADLNWGTASAATVTLSFWVRSSVTGTFSGALYGASTIQSYPFTYTISSANTFEQKTVTISGPTTGTWDSTNGAGIYVNFDLGSGTTFKTTAGSWATGTYIGVTGATNLCETSSATFYITGVQLEVGSVATEFERRPYGTELALCQRYFIKSFNDGTAPSNGNNSTSFSTYLGIYSSTIDRPATGGPPTANDSTTAPQGTYGSFAAFPVKMRTTPTMTAYGNNGSVWWLQGVGSGGVAWYGPQSFMGSMNGFTPCFASPISTDAIGMVFGHWTASAEL